MAMSRRTRIGIGVATAVAAVVAAGIGTAYAVSGGDSNAVTGSTADRARAAAVAAVPGGRAAAVDRESGKGNTAYGVHVTKPDGSTVEVHLDSAFTVLDVQPAVDGGDGDDGDDG